MVKSYYNIPALNVTVICALGVHVSGYLGKGLVKLLLILKGSAIPVRLKNAILQNATEVFFLVHMHECKTIHCTREHVFRELQLFSVSNLALI